VFLWGSVRRRRQYMERRKQTHEWGKTFYFDPFFDNKAAAALFSRRFPNDRDGVV